MHKGSIPTAKKPKKSLSCALDKKKHFFGSVFSVLFVCGEFYFLIKFDII